MQFYVDIILYYVYEVVAAMCGKNIKREGERKVMAKAKVYAIFYDEEAMYFPVKAMLDPHNKGTLAYCADMPVFFGGSYTYPERGDYVPQQLEALKKEVREESQGNLELAVNFRIVGNVNAKSLLEIKDGSIWYNFYAIKTGSEPEPFIEKEVPYGDDGIFTLGTEQERPEAEKEQQCIVKLDRPRIIGADKAERLANFINECKSKDFCKCHFQAAVFMQSHTKTAFETFFDEFHS